jgi:Zn-finger nucleic acid-binding protein
MTDPYRSSTGLKCVRCKQALLADGDDSSCGDGCGIWIARAAIERLLPMTALANVRANPFKAHPFKPARCPVCKASLADHYAGDRQIISLGQCSEHGIWIDGASRADFEAVYAGEIRSAEHAREASSARDRKAERDHARALDALRGTDTVNLEALVKRLAELEALLRSKS